MTVKYGEALLQDDGFSMMLFGVVDVFEYLGFGSLPVEVELMKETLDAEPRSHG